MPRRLFSERFSAALSVFFVLALTIFSTGQAHAQVTGATLSGTVTDASGAVIPGVQVSIKNRATGVTRNITTDELGFYSAPNLLAGNYDVTVSAPGFSTAVQSNIALAVGAQQQLNISLKIGETNQVVEVTEAAPMVQVASSVISNQVEATTVRELPLNGRDWASLATLSPGVNAIETQMPFESGAVRGNRGFGAQLTISGGRPTQNNYRLDGLSINDYGNGGPGSVIGVSLGVDAIQEFSVLTGNYSAEYGRTSGGVVNAISKSGTNAFHGDIYEFLRNDKLDANDFFSNASRQLKPPYKRNQFGAAAGGPIRKDRTFIFGDYEGIRQSQGIVSSGTIVLSDAARAGNLVNGRVDVDPLVAKYLALYPRANGPVTGDKGVFTFAGVRVVKENYFTSRVDHKVSDKDSLFGTYMYDNTPYTQPDNFNNVKIRSQTARHIAALEDSHIFSPGFVNTARLGFNRNAVINYEVFEAINSAAQDPSLGMMLGRNSPSIRISGGFANMPAGLPGGFSHHNWNSYQFYDDAFLTRGTHSLKFGFAGENMRYNFFQFYNPQGIVRFTSLANFLTNRPNSLEGGLPDRINPRGLRQTLLGGYIQDDWHMRHNLTLNLGLRYQMTTVLSEVQGKLTNLRSMTDPLPYCGTTDPSLTLVFGKPGCTGVAPYYSNPTTRNFEPRLGFAWDPRGDGKMAVRGGFAIFDVLPLPGYYYTQQGIETPFTLVGVVTNSPANPLAGTLGIPPSDPRSAYAKLGGGSLTGAFMEPDPKRNYVEQWNVNVQREIAPNLTATVGYIGSHGVHMLVRGDDGNMVIPTKTSAGYLWPYNPPNAAGQTKDLRINPNFGGIRFMSFGASSSYESLQFNVQKRMSHGFQFGGSYTYSKTMDDSSATIAGDAFSNSVTSWFWFASDISHAPSDFDVRHTASINGIWQMPVSQSLHGPAATMLRGWQLGGILKLNSGIPTTPLIGGDPLGVQNSGSDAFSIPDRVPGCDRVNHDFKSNPGGVFLGYINPKCFTLPKATPEIASQCVPFGFSAPGSSAPNPGIPGTCSNLIGNAGRNSIYGPRLFNLDASVYKNFAVSKISESFNVQFRAEFFNVLNHANFGPPLPFFGSGSAQLFNPNGSLTGAGGLQAPVVTQPRDIQFALKVIW
jgi:hypothetical protein